MVKNIKEKDGITKMAQQNDERIMSLKKQIEEKKAELEKLKTRFVPETNCMLELDSARYNLHTITDPCNLLLLLKLSSLMMAAEKLDINPDDVMISGYSLSLWINDIKNKMKADKYKLEKNNLNNIEKQLTDLLSSDKQTELKIDALESLIH